MYHFYFAQYLLLSQSINIIITAQLIFLLCYIQPFYACLISSSFLLLFVHHNILCEYNQGNGSLFDAIVSVLALLLAIFLITYVHFAFVSAIQMRNPDQTCRRIFGFLTANTMGQMRDWVMAKINNGLSSRSCPSVCPGASTEFS